MDAFCLRTVTTIASRPSLYVATPATKEISGFDVVVNPNPVINYFDIVAKTGDNITPVNVRILSADGRVVSVEKTAANSTLKIQTEKWKSGMYFIEATQGGQRKVVKLVKL